MDSGNSGSLQSSSGGGGGGGGDEEYDSRAADSFIITSHVGGLPISPPSFDPISSYMQQLGQNPNLFLNPNAAWPGPGTGPGTISLRSDPNPHEFNNPMLSGFPVFQPPADPPAGQTPSQATPRNPRKRSRASRRAPTTVLTTDTTNFRAMVQEFTGIPAPPFNSSSLPRTRLDLYGGTRSASMEPPYFLRPFAQKVQSTQPPFPTPSAANNLFNFPNPLINSLLQSNPKIFPNSPSKPNLHDPFEIPSKIDGMDEFGLSSGNHVDPALTGLPNLISTDQIAGGQKNPDHATADENGASWKNNDEGSHYQAQIRPVVNGSYNFPGITATGKTNPPASTSDEKRPENIGGKEGMMESWICSSE